MPSKDSVLATESEVLRTFRTYKVALASHAVLETTKNGGIKKMSFTLDDGRQGLVNLPYGEMPENMKRRRIKFMNFVQNARVPAAAHKIA